MPVRTRKRGLTAATDAGGSGAIHDTIEAPDQPPAAAAPPVAAVPTPDGSRRRKQATTRKPPQDIGISALILGGGADVQAVAAAADAVDELPLATAGFTPASLQAACDYLSQRDPRLVGLIQAHGPPERLLKKSGSNFATLAKAIVFQQLATNAAAAIYGRVLTACECTEQLTPAAVLAAPVAALRAAGLSERKASYMADLARHFSDGSLSDAAIEQMEEAALEKALVAVRGIGLWTVHMHAMFHLGSPDVLPVGDLGVRRGMQQLYGLKDVPDAAAMERISECWRPFRSLGSYYMWKVDVPRSSAPAKKKKKS